MLGYLLAAVVTEKVVKGIGETVADVAREKRLAAEAELKANKSRSKQQKTDARQARQAELERQRREYNESLRQQEIAKENARRQAEAQRQKEMTATLKQLYAKFAICYYIALADGELAQQEKSELDRLCLDVYNKFPYPAVKNELLKIYNTKNMNFIILEKYIREVDPTIIASFLSLAEETAELDGNTTEQEKECIYKLRKHLTDKTGHDYLSNTMHLKTDVNLQCPGCGSCMKVVPYDNKAVCPYCGHFKYLQPSKNT